MAAFALIGPAIKALASGGVKKAAMGAAKGAVKGKAKDFVTGKNRKGKGGALAKSEGGGEEQVEGGKGGAIVPTTPMVGNYKVETLSDKPDEVGKPSKVSYEAINNQLDSIIGLTNVLKKTSTAKIKNAENRRKAERKANEKDKKRQRESLLEKGAGKALGMAGNLYGKATEAFDPLKFFTMIFLGNLVKWFNEEGSKISAFLRTGLALLNNAGKLINSGLKALGGAFKAGFKLIGKLPRAILGLGKNVGKTLFNVGKRLGSAFIGLGKRLFKFVKGLLGRLRIPGFPTPKGPTPKGPRPKGTTPKGTTPKGTTPKGRVSPRIGDKLRKMGLTNNQITAYNNARQGGAGATDALTQARKTPPKTKFKLPGGKALNGFLKKLFGIVKPSEVESLRKAGPALKKGGNFMKGARIPVVGPMIVFALNALDPDVSIGEAAFKAIGTGLGEFLGFAIPIPVLGPLIGGLVGEVMGAAAYSLIIEKNPAAAGKKIMDAVTATGKFLGPILDWVKGVVVKFFDALPKVNLFGKEFLNPLVLTPPMVLTEVPKALMSAFFGKDMKKGKVEKKETGEPSESDKMMTGSTTSGSTPSVSSGGEINFAKEMIKIHEGSNIVGDVHQAYRDSEGLPTIGYGHLIIPGDGYDMNSKISQSEADSLFDKDFQKHLEQAKAIPGYNKGNVQQKAALIDLTFNMGGSFYKDFPKFAAAVKSGDFQTAAAEIQDSDYYKQVGRRGPVIRDLLAGKGVSASYLKNIKVPTGNNLSTDSNEGVPIQSENLSTPSDGLETTSAATPAKVSPSTSSQTQMSNGIDGISQQLSYEESGNTVVMMQASNNQQSPMSSGGGGKGTPVMMGSGDVVNSYYKSQLMGFLYKQG